MLRCWTYENFFASELYYYRRLSLRSLPCHISYVKTRLHSRERYCYEWFSSSKGIGLIHTKFGNWKTGVTAVGIYTLCAACVACHFARPVFFSLWPKLACVIAILSCCVFYFQYLKLEHLARKIMTYVRKREFFFLEKISHGLKVTRSHPVYYHFWETSESFAY